MWKILLVCESAKVEVFFAGASNDEENSQVFAKIDVSSHEEKSTKRSNGKTSRVTPTSSDVSPNEVIIGVNDTTAGASIAGENAEGKNLSEYLLSTIEIPKRNFARTSVQKILFRLMAPF